MGVCRLEGQSLGGVAMPFIEWLTQSSFGSLKFSPFQACAYKVNCGEEVDLQSRIDEVFTGTLQLRLLEDASLTDNGKAKVWEVIAPREIQGGQVSLVARVSPGPRGVQMMEMAVRVEGLKDPVSEEMKFFVNVDKRTFQGGKTPDEFMRFIQRAQEVKEKYITQMDAIINEYLPQAVTELHGRVQVLK
ncbi:MAG: hypothetical protein FJZ63_03000 [Chlamydiae bacterium]|nr:hypothetical protein [Chlamydiota bacterium]